MQCMPLVLHWLTLVGFVYEVYGGQVQSSGMKSIHSFTDDTIATKAAAKIDEIRRLNALGALLLREPVSGLRLFTPRFWPSPTHPMAVQRFGQGLMQTKMGETPSIQPDLNLQDLDIKQDIEREPLELQPINKAILEKVKCDICPTPDPKAAAALEEVLLELTMLNRNTVSASRAAVTEIASEDLSIAQLKERATALGIQEPVGNKRLKKTWSDAIAAAASAKVAPEVSELAVASAHGGSMSVQPSSEILDKTIAPYLSLVLHNSFPRLLREQLQNVRTEAGLSAIRQLNDYMIGVVTQMEDAIGDEQWMQQQKLGELCSAALEGPEALKEVAEAMRDSKELDAKFCNYLNFAIQQEEASLQEEGVAPVISLKQQQEKELQQTATDRESVVGGGATEQENKELASNSMEDEEEPVSVFEQATTQLLSSSIDQSEPEDTNKTAALKKQQWLLILHAVRKGTYDMLGNDYREDIELIRYIMAMSTKSARRELFMRSMDDLNDDRKKEFLATIERIAGNLAGSHPPVDEQLFAKMLELKTFTEEFNEYFGR